MSGIETKIQIDQIEDSKNLRYSTVTPELKSSSDVDDIYRKDILAKGVNFSDTDTTKIIKLADGTFLIGKKDGEYTDAILKVGTTELLKSLIKHSIDKFNRDELTKLGGEVHEQFDTEYKTYTDATTKEQKEEIVITTTEKLNELKNEIISLDDIKEILNTLIGGDYTIKGVKESTKGGQYDEIKKLLKKQKKMDTIQKANVEIFNQLLDTSKEKHLDQIARDIKAIKNNDFTQNQAEATSVWKAELEYIHAQFSQIERYILDTDLMQKPFDRTIYNIETAAYSANDVKKLLKKIKAQDKEEKDINELEFNAALTKIDTDEQERFRIYLNSVLNGTIDPAKEQFTPTKIEDFKTLCADYPFLKGYICFTCAKNNTSTTNIGNTNNSPDNTINNSTNTPVTKETYADYKEAFKKGGVAGEMGYWLDKSKMSNEQKQFWGGVGNLALTGGMIFIGWKMISSAFKLLTGADSGDDKKAARRKDRAWLYGPAAILFTSQALTGEGPMGLVKGGAASQALGDVLFGKSATEKTKTGTGGIGGTPETGETNKDTAEVNKIYGEGFPGLTALFAGSNYKEMKSYLEQKDGKIKLSDSGYTILHDKYTSGDEANTVALGFLDDIGKDDDKGIIDLALDAMGITRDGMDKTPDKKFNVTASNNIIRLAAIEPFMEDNQYARINKETLPLIKNYIKGIKADGTEDQDLPIKYLDTLAKRGDVFEKEPTEDKTGLADKVKEIAKDNVDEQELIIKALNAFKEKMPNANKDIDISGTRPEVTFTTYGQSTKINVAKKSLVGFTPKGFDSYLELFKAANLTNRIKFLYKDKFAVEKNPFYVSPNLGVTGNDITFNNAKVFSTDFDTTAVSAGWGGALEDISPILEDNKEAYCTYLNTMNWKIKPVEVKKVPETPKYTGLDSELALLGASATELVNLKKGISKFYEYMPSSEKNETIHITGTRPNVEFETYGQKTKMNLSSKKITGLETSAPFADYFELFKAASLSNYFRKVCKFKTTEKGLPYYVSSLGEISFNGTDDNVGLVSTGLFDKLDNISEVLSQKVNKQRFVDYLNLTRDPTGNIDVIKAMSNSQETQLKILNSINLFYNEMPSDKRNDIKLTGTLTSAKFKTYKQITEINLDTKAIKDLGIVFLDDEDDNYLELMKAANLTNYIRSIFKDKSGGDEPFNTSFLGGDIEFAQTWKIFDTEAVSAGIGGSLGDVSESLEDKKSIYVAYLNKLHFWKP